MAGIKQRIEESLQFRLSFWLSIAIMAMALVAGIASFRMVFLEAHNLQDEILRQIAALYDDKHVPSDVMRVEPGLTDEQAEARVVVQRLRTPDAVDGVRNAETSLDFPSGLSDGLHTQSADNVQYRVLVKTLAPGVRVAVAQETAVRDEMAQDSAMHTLMPLLLLVPVLLLLVADIVRKAFRPIALMSSDIDRRGDSDLHPLTLDRLPIEVRPFAVAINHLLARIAESMATKRRFVADAAHELRSPLTAISLQVEYLTGAQMSSEAHQRLTVLKTGIKRCRSLIDQLLVHARVQEASIPPKTGTSVRTVFRQVLEELMPLVDEKNIDIGVQGEDDACVMVTESDLFTMVRNLVDNAVRYTPEGGRIDLSTELANEWVVVNVVDNGSGIPEEYKERVLDPFFRVPGSQMPGSGLGLSIVQTVLHRYGGRLTLVDANDISPGLKASLYLPLTTGIA